jgi:hypothetical protein
VQGEVPHKQYICWLQMKAQANYRKELWMLSFEEYQTIWQGRWDQKGRGIDDFCLTREDQKGAWVWGNVLCIPRHEHLRRSGLYKKEKRKWQTQQEAVNYGGK